MYFVTFLHVFPHLYLLGFFVSPFVYILCTFRHFGPIQHFLITTI